MTIKNKVNLDNIPLSIPYALRIIAKNKILVNVYGKIGKIYVCIRKVNIRMSSRGEYTAMIDDGKNEAFLSFKISCVDSISTVKEDNGAYDIHLVSDIDDEMEKYND